MDVSFVHLSHMVRQVGGKFTHIKANRLWIFAISYLILTIIYKNTSNIGIWRVREWIWVEILPTFLIIWRLLRRICYRISWNFLNSIGNFQKSFTSDIFEKYYVKFLEIFSKKNSDNILETFENSFEISWKNFGKFWDIVVVTKKSPMCQIMRLSIYSINGLIEGKHITLKNSNNTLLVVKLELHTQEFL